MYVAEISKVTKFSDIEKNIENPGKGNVIYDQFPTEWPHGWKYIAFGPDGKLYVPVGAPFNIGEPTEKDASLFRMNDDGTGFEKFAKGTAILLVPWHPKTHALWFTDNGRDALGDDVPFDELNTAPKAGMNFGYPYYHSGTIKDPRSLVPILPSEFTHPR